MKTILSALFVIISLSLAAQQIDSTQSNKPKSEEIQTLLGSHVRSGFYGALMFNYGVINEHDALLTGVRAAWVINHSLALGFGGYGFVNDVHFDDKFLGEYSNLAGGYGGLYIEPIVGAKKPIHLAFPILIGVGGVSSISRYGQSDNLIYYSNEVDVFTVIEPGIEVELNVLKFFRVGVGATYRKAFGLDLANTKSSVLDGINYGVSLKFGKF